jgi:DNA end-binding protein Ku
MAASARAIWKGSISFGLVNIPIQVFSATQKEEYTSFNQLDDKGHRIKYKKWCPVEEREVPYSELKKGYEISKDNYVVLEEEDLEGIKLKTNNTIEVKEFIESEELILFSLRRTTMLDLILVRKRVPAYQAKHILYLSRY